MCGGSLYSKQSLIPRGLVMRAGLYMGGYYGPMFKGLEEANYTLIGLEIGYMY